MRVCSECNEKMNKGYCIDNGLEYYCSDECLHEHYTEEEYLEMYDDGNGDSYWTEWEPIEFDLRSVLDLLDANGYEDASNFLQLHFAEEEEE